LYFTVQLGHGITSGALRLVQLSSSLPDWNNPWPQLSSIHNGIVSILSPPISLHLADSSFPFDPETSAYDNDPIHLDSTPEATETITCPNSDTNPSLPLFNIIPDYDAPTKFTPQKSQQ